MTKSEKRCSHCGGKFGLICYHHWGLRFCRKALQRPLHCKGRERLCTPEKVAWLLPRLGA
jgi:hypothetical protein